MVTAFSADGVPERDFRLPEIRDGQSFPASMAIGFHLVDYVVHGWDVAATLGLPFELPAEVLAVALPIARAVPGGAARTAPGAAFAPALSTPDNADPLTEILTLLGRSPEFVGSPR